MIKTSKFFFLALLFLVACGDEYQPKPKGYFRIALPGAEYQSFAEDCPYTFEYNKVAKLTDKGQCWYDLRYPDIKATLQLTYKAVNENNLDTLLGEAHALAYKHTVRADGIQEQLYLSEEHQVYGLFYQLAGGAASSRQFFMTDSTHHFLRGVLYFYASPNADSLRPVNEFMTEEISHLIETLRWKNS